MPNRSSSALLLTLLLTGACTDDPAATVARLRTPMAIEPAGVPDEDGVHPYLFIANASSGGTRGSTGRGSPRRVRRTGQSLRSMT